MGGIGVIGKDSNVLKTFMEMGLEKAESIYLMRKIISICIRSTYFIFCQRNNAWEAQGLMAW